MKKHVLLIILFIFKFSIIKTQAQIVTIPLAERHSFVCPPFLNYSTLGSTLDFIPNNGTGTAYYAQLPPWVAYGEEKIIRFTPSVTSVYDFVYSDNFTPNPIGAFNTFHYRPMNAVCDRTNYIDGTSGFYYPTSNNNITYWHYSLTLNSGTTYEMLIQPTDSFVTGLTSVIIDCFTPIIFNGSNGHDLCPGGSVQLILRNTASPLPGITYQWKLNGFNIPGATQSSYTATTAGSYTCVASGACGTKTSSPYSVQSANVPNAPVVSGSTGFCRPSSGNIYSVQPQQGLSYNWSVSSGATITNGQAGSNATVSFAANAGNVNVCITTSNYCGASIPSCKTLVPRSSVPSAPSAIAGSNNGCINEVKLYSIRKVANADSYVWTSPVGATINASTDTFIYVTYTAAFAGDTLRVRAVNCRGNSTERKLRINHIAPSTPGAISGLKIGLCNQSNVPYTINAVTNAKNYTWRSTIAGVRFNGNYGPYTTTYTSVNITYTTFTTGQIFVKANNGCGSSAERSLTVNAKPAVPAIINGPVSVCDAQLGVAYSTSAVANTTTYNWTVPSG
ncbi:MAG: hypothetical protein ABI772_11250, partial [Bacteroidota bacterium]